MFKAALLSVETAGGLPVEALVTVDGRAAPGPAGSEPEVRQLQDVYASDDNAVKSLVVA